MYTSGLLPASRIPGRVSFFLSFPFDQKGTSGFFFLSSFFFFLKNQVNDTRRLFFVLLFVLSSFFVLPFFLFYQKGLEHRWLLDGLKHVV